MKKIYLAGAFLLAGIMANAQTEKGDIMIGGRIDLNTGENSTYIGFSPQFGYFIITNLAIGGNLSLTYQKNGDAKNTDFGIGPFVRWYFTQAKVRPLLHGSLNFLSSNSKGPGYSNTNTGINFFLGGGAAIFINENVSIEGLLGYSHTKYKDFDGSGGLNLGIGFQVYLNKGQVDRLRGK